MEGGSECSALFKSTRDQNCVRTPLYRRVVALNTQQVSNAVSAMSCNSTWHSFQRFVEACPRQELHLMVIVLVIVS